MSMLAYVPIPVILPLALAAILAGTGGLLPRRAIDVIALLGIAVVGLACGAMAVAAARHGSLVYWFGNWHPDQRVGSPTRWFPTGVCFVVEPMGAALATLVSTLMFAAMTFSWSYFEEVKSLFHALMLVFLAAMCGMCLSGDLFNLFVWFELMTAAAVALCGYKAEEGAPLLGALNFAIVNSLGAFVSLGGVAIVYAYTGTLNLAEAGRALAAHPPGAAFVAVAFVLTCGGFLVKSAAVPFQFWLADAHAVAPTPVCVLFSGAMVEIGLFAVARVYWTTFAPAFGPHADAVRDVFLTMGALTAIVGALFAFGQRHLKRMLALSTVSHVGLMIVGFAMLRPDALSGVGVYVIGHGLIKATLFLCAGMLLHRCGSVDEFDLRGSGRNQWPLGAMMAVATLGLAGLPPFATFYGGAQIHEAAEALRIAWARPLGVIVDALTAAAVLRVTARVFLGWGATQEATSRGAPHVPMDRETAADHDRTPPCMWVPAACLLALAAGIAAWPEFRAATAAAADHFSQTSTIAAATLDGVADPIGTAAVPPAPLHVDHLVTLALIAVALLLTLRPAVLGQRLNWAIGHAVPRFIGPLRRLQSGNVGDYVAFLVIGIAAYGGLLVVLTMR